MRRRPYVLLPARGLRWPGGADQARAALAMLPGRSEVLDTLVEPRNGAALVALPPGGARALRRAAPDVQVARLRLYQSAISRPEVLTRAPAAGSSDPCEVRVVSGADARPLAGVLVVAFSDFAARTGDQGHSDAEGHLRLHLGQIDVIERLYVFGATGHWSLLRRRVPVRDQVRLVLRPLDHAAGDGLGFRYGAARAGIGRGVRIAVVDTGVDLEHPDLVVAGGRNCVTGEDPARLGPNGEGHGTHVAGIIAARGYAPRGRRGVAPGAELMSYRVFGEGQADATNFAIAKAVDAAVEDGCDVVNLSLGGGAPDPVVRAAIEEAQLAGLVVVAAAGNDTRRPVVFPADLPDVVAVSALGRTGTYPPDAAGSAERRGPYGHDGADFVAGFSNIGAVDMTAPGVAIVSTVPGGYQDLDGTSMACPAVTGITARLLSGHRRLRSQRRGPDRAAAVLAELARRARPLGFPSSHEGAGLAR